MLLNKYWKTHNFDPVNIEYYDPDKEKEFRETRIEKQKTHGQDWVQKLPKSWKEEGGLYNPVNGRIQDEKRLYERDLREKNKRKRFELRYDMERQVHKQALGEEERMSKISLNKINVQRFRDTTDRGFDILTNKQFNKQAEEGSKMLHNPHVNPPPSTWTKIKNSSNAFDDFQREESDHAQSVPAQESTPMVGSTDDPKAGDLNDDLYNTIHGDFRKMVERRSKRLIKGNKTMSNFRKTSEITKPESIKPAGRNSVAKDIVPTKLETNESALRQTSNVNLEHTKNEPKIGTTALRTGRSVMSEGPNSNAMSKSNKSSRVIRTGAFQKINS